MSALLYYRDLYQSAFPALIFAPSSRAMSIQRNKTEDAEKRSYATFYQSNQNLMAEIGLPLSATETYKSFQYFLMHGTMYHNPNHADFDIDQLTPAKLVLYKKLISNYLNEGFPNPGIPPLPDAKIELPPIYYSSQMDTNNSEQTLISMLVEHGIDLARPDPQLVWQTFKQFVSLPLSDPTVIENNLFECGIYNFESDHHFFIDLVRQFEFSTLNGDYDHMEQLHCTLKTPITPALQNLKISIWSEAYADLQTFFTAVESQPNFHQAIFPHPYILQIWHDTL